MITVKVLYNNKTNFIFDIVSELKNCYIELYNMDTFKLKSKLRGMQERFGSKNYPLIIFEDENLTEYDAIYSESIPNWEEEILKRLNG